MTSPSLLQKIAKARQAAPSELPMARLCAAVILAAVESEEAVHLAIARLKEALGSNWSHVTALQFMSGRRGEFAADCSLPEEQVSLHLAHLVAQQVCNEQNLAGVRSPDGLDVAKIRVLFLATQAGRQKKKLTAFRLSSET
jgi:hypothetical protein